MNPSLSNLSSRLRFTLCGPIDFPCFHEYYSIQKQKQSPLFSQDIEKGVPLSTIQTVSITSALLTLMATKDLTFAALALLGMALVTITPGPIGITCRTVGDLIFTTVTSFWKLSEKLGVKDAVSNRLAKMDYTNKMDRIRRVETEVQTILQQAEETLQGADSEMVEIQKFQTDVQDVLKEADSAISSAIQIQEDKMRLAAEEAKVLKLTQKAEKADEKMREVAETASRLADETARVAAEVAAKKAEEPIVDISIPYDAPARNAYEASGKKGDFKAFKADYEAAAVAGVISKKEAKEADAARVAEEARVAEKARVAEEERLAEETRLAEEARLAEEERLAEEARVAEEERLAKEARLAEEAELAEEARLAEEQRVAEEARLAEEQKQADEDEAARLAATDPDVEEGDFSDMDWDTSVEMAKDSMDGTIVGIDDVDVDDSEKAEWDAAKVFAKSLNEGQKEPPLVFDDETPAVEPEEIDMEALARAAREAVEKFEQQQLVDEEVSDDGDAFTPVFDDEASMEDIAEAARKAAEMYNSDLVDDDDQEDIFFDDIDEDEDVAAESTPPVQIQDWSTLKVVDLKAELGARGLTPKGKKADLVAMLVDSDAERLLAASESPAPTTDNSGADEEFDFSDMDLEEIGRAAREAAELFDGEEPSDEVLMMLENEEVDLLEPEPVEETPAKGKAAPSDYSSMNVAALKDELRSRGLKVSGRKQELIARLQSSD